jgi:hypothetical protein
MLRAAMRASILLAALATSALAAHPAAAETKSWSAIKARLPAGTAIVVGVDFKAVRGLPSFQAMLGALFSEAKDLKQTVELVKTACGFELPGAIADLTIVANLREKGAVVIGLDGLDQTKLLACAEKVHQKADPKAKITAKPGKVTEYSVTGMPAKLFAAWLANDVIAIGTEATSRDVLDALLAGKAPSAELAGALKGTNTGALLWGAAAVNKEGIKGGAGSLTHAKGTLAISVKLTAMSADVAKQMVAEMKQKLADRIKSGEQAAPKIARLLKLVTVAQRGTADVAIEIAVPETELPVLLPAFDKLF